MMTKTILGMIAVLALSAAEVHVLAAQEPVAAATGTIEGMVTFQGTSPKPKRLNLAADPACVKANPGLVMNQDVIVGSSGELTNVIVYIDGQVPGSFPTPSAPAVLDQKGCMYNPHVLAIYDGQKVEIRNSDQTLHNVHCYKGTQTCFNRAMFQGMAPIMHTFTEHGNIVTFKCDVHPWMTAHAYVATNPFFATTGTDGKFTISNVPAGTYTLKFWHEKFGEKTAQAKVVAGQKANVNVAFKKE